MRKILCIVLAFVICSFSVFSYVHAEENTTNTQDTNNTNDQATDLQTKQQDYDALIETVAAQPGGR